MKRLVTNDRVRVGAWVAERVGRQNPWVKDAALGLEDEHGNLVGGIVIDGYVPHARGSMHCAGEGRTWLNRMFLKACFEYAFIQLGLKVLISPVSAENKDSLKFIKHIGFTELARIPLAWNGEEDLVLFELRRGNCRWIGEHHELHQQKAA